MPKRSLTAGKGHTLRPVGFDVAADAYSRFMGRYSIPLAPRFADFAGIASGQSVLDVGCGPGALTAELVTRVGASSVSAVDPSSPFVEAVRERHRGVRVQRAAAEHFHSPRASSMPLWHNSWSISWRIPSREA